MKIINKWTVGTTCIVALALGTIFILSSGGPAEQPGFRPFATHPVRMWLLSNQEIAGLDFACFVLSNRTDRPVRYLQDRKSREPSYLLLQRSPPDPFTRRVVITNHNQSRMTLMAPADLPPHSSVAFTVCYPSQVTNGVLSVSYWPARSRAQTFLHNLSQQVLGKTPLPPDAYESIKLNQPFAKLNTCRYLTLITIAVTCSSVLVAQTTNHEFTAEISGITVELPADWKATQVRAHHPDHGVEMNAGTFPSELSVAQCAAVIATSLTANSRDWLEKIARRVDLSPSEIQKTIGSPAGRKLATQVKEGSPARFQLLDVYYQTLKGGRQFDIRSQSIRQKGETLYRRDFVLGGATPGEIVQITYIGASEAVFTNRAIIRSVKPSGTRSAKP